jgi:hypothetical protein
MEDAAIDGADWGRAGMALFNDIGFGAAKDPNYAQTWRAQIGQTSDKAPVLNLPIEQCRPLGAKRATP